MAEAPDSTRSTDVTAGPPRRDAVPAFLPPPADTGTVYKPLSLGALAGFGLALFYSLFIVGFALFAYLTGDFLLFPFWTILIPLGVAALCFVSRRSVRNSEGTLGGERLATWGIGLTAVVGLAYWSYYAATAMALRQQAANFVLNKFIPAVAKGNLEESFVLTYKGSRPTINNKLRGFVEANLNTPTNLKTMPPYTAYLQTEYVRLLQMGGDKLQVTLTSTGTPVPVQGGEMQVPLTFHVDTPAKSFDLQAVAAASEVRTKDFSGRLWRVDRDRTWVVPQSWSWNPDGNRLFDKGEKDARLCATAWVAKLNEVSERDSAVDETLPPARRAVILPKVRGKKPEELKKLAEKDPDVREYVEALKAFAEGSAVRAERDTFWASSDQLRNEVIARVKQEFTHTGATSNWLILSKQMPTWAEKDGKVRFDYDVYLMLLPAYVGSARVSVEAPEDALTNKDANYDSWKVVALDLIRGQAAPAKAEEGGKNTMQPSMQP